MHGLECRLYQHEHNYLSADQERAERNTRRVIALSATMMVVEILGGAVFNSMALLADGWHMASHTSALGITAFAYAYARRHAGDARYSFGTWKVGVLGGFTSAVVLAVIALLIAWESLGRLRHPLAISFDEAIFVAVLGLTVNLISACILHAPRTASEHLTGTTADHDHHHDHNLRAAYLHVLADALTSFFAIFALFTGKFLGWVWMDPSMGIVGSAVIGRWSYGLLRDTSRVLLDGDVEPDVANQLCRAIEENADDRVTDLHLWRVGPDDLSAIVCITTHNPQTPNDYKKLLSASAHLSHVTVEVNSCHDQPRTSQSLLGQHLQ